MKTLDEQLADAIQALRAADASNEFRFAVYPTIRYYESDVPKIDWQVFATSGATQCAACGETLPQAVADIVAQLQRTPAMRAAELREQAQKLIAQAAELEGK